MTMIFGKGERAEPMPFKPALPDKPGNSFVRLATAHVLAHVRRVRPADVAAQMWPQDRALHDLLTRTATVPAMTSVDGWAAELAQKHVIDTLDALGPMSSGVQLLRLGLVLSFDRAGLISAPGFVADFANAGFVAEGASIPVHQLALGVATLAPHKIAAIGVLTREMIESSNAEKLVGDVFIRSIGRMLDEVLWDANPGDAERPAGLRYNIAALTASNNTVATEAAFEDMVALINAVAPVGGPGPYVFVASPGRAVSMQARLGREFSNVKVLGSSAVINDIMCIAPVALVSAIGGDPEIETAKAATLHMDTVPQPVGSVAPARSLWQTDSIALKGRWPLSWALRDPRGFAWTTPTWKV